MKNLVWAHSTQTLFLSHLCGDEARYLTDLYINRFLSHLCGDEVNEYGDESIIDFLSHLCGDEVIVAKALKSL